MRYLVLALSVWAIILNYQLWLANNDSVHQLRQLTEAVQTQTAENAALSERNQALAAEVASLKQGLAAIEERARTELGMIRKDETFFRILETTPYELKETP